MVIDGRAGSKNLLLPLQQERVPAILGTLAFGDVAFGGRGPNGQALQIGVEYKSLADLLACMTSGRLAGHQLPGMQRDYDVRWLLVEGIWRRGDNGCVEVRDRWRAKQHGGSPWVPLQIGGRYYMARDLYGYLFSLAQQGGIRIWKTSSLDESAAWIAALWRWWQRDWDEHASLQTFDLSGPMVGLTEPPFTRRVAKELPGIGWKRSLAVMQQFPSVAQMVYAEPEDWMRIEGVGKTLAPRIVAALHGWS